MKTGSCQPEGGFSSVSPPNGKEEVWTVSPCKSPRAAAFGILELVRTGMVALERGAYTIGDETKEQTEFNLGKNFL